MTVREPEALRGERQREKVILRVCVWEEEKEATLDPGKTLRLK